MRQSLTYLDVPVLLGAGFKYGLTDEILWGKCKEGKEWQVHVDGMWLTFATREGRTLSSRSKMKRTEFYQRFAA